MAENTKIEWTDHTWNPITGCTLVDQGCKNCYAAELASTRLKHHRSREGLATKNADGVAKFTGEVRFNGDWLTQPLRWRNPRMIFVCAHGDLFHENVPDDWIDRVFAVMALCPQHTFQVLTKRPERAARYLKRIYEMYVAWREHPIGIAAAEIGLDHDQDPYEWHSRALDRLHNYTRVHNGLPNIWLGTSVSDQKSAEARIPHLLNSPAAVRFLSAEPLLGPLNLTSMNNGYVDALLGRDAEGYGRKFDGIDWVIVGGESGRNARPMHPDWVKSLRDQCKSAEVPFFFKQWGEWMNGSDFADDATVVLSDGRVISPITEQILKAYEVNADLHPNPTMMRKVGKKAAGRELDGIEHNEFPRGLSG